MTALREEVRRAARTKATTAWCAQASYIMRSRLSSMQPRDRAQLRHACHIVEGVTVRWFLAGSHHLCAACCGAGWWRARRAAAPPAAGTRAPLGSAEPLRERARGRKGNLLAMLHLKHETRIVNSHNKWLSCAACVSSHRLGFRIRINLSAQHVCAGGTIHAPSQHERWKALLHSTHATWMNARQSVCTVTGPDKACEVAQ
jgi:hypothetical protein